MYWCGPTSLLGSYPWKIVLATAGVANAEGKQTKATGLETSGGVVYTFKRATGPETGGGVIYTCK